MLIFLKEVVVRLRLQPNLYLNFNAKKKFVSKFCLIYTYILTLLTIALTM